MLLDGGGRVGDCSGGGGWDGVFAPSFNPSQSACKPCALRSAAYFQPKMRLTAGAFQAQPCHQMEFQVFTKLP